MTLASHRNVGVAHARAGTKAEPLRAWLVRWLYAAAVAHLLVGVLLPWLADAALLDGYHRGIVQAFWPAEPAPPAALAHQAWWMALFGPTVQTVGIWMIALVRIADQQRNASAWAWLIAGILVWAPQDIMVSLRAEVWTNVWLDCFAVIAMVLPLAWLWRHDGVTRSAP